MKKSTQIMIILTIFGTFIGLGMYFDKFDLTRLGQTFAGEDISKKESSNANPTVSSGTGDMSGVSGSQDSQTGEISVSDVRVKDYL